MSRHSGIHLSRLKATGEVESVAQQGSDVRRRVPVQSDANATLASSIDLLDPRSATLEDVVSKVNEIVEALSGRVTKP